MNPCPCGFAGDPRCTCDDKQIEKYQRRLSGPFLDRIDLQVVLKPLSNDERFSDATADESGILRAKVEKSRERQRIRFAGTAISCNAAIPGGAISDYCTFSQAGNQVFREAIDRGSVSTRTVDRLAKVSRTIADLDKSDTIEPHHVEEASKFVAGGILQK